MKNVLFIFGQLTDEDVQWMAKSGVVEAVAEGQTLIRQGQPIGDVYVTLEGEFAVGQQGQEFARIGGGEMLGEMSFLEQSLPSADVRVSIAGKVLKLRRADLQRRLEQHEGFAARFYRGVALILSARLRDARASADDPRLPGVLEPDELDPTVLDGVSQAGERFTRLLRAARN